MRTPEEFKAYYESHMRPRLQELEALRLRYRPRMLLYSGWIWPTWGAIIAWGFAKGMSPLEVLRDWVLVHIAAGLTFIAILLWRGLSHVIRTGRVQKRCKQEVIRPMLGWIAPELTYEPEGGMDVALMEASHLFRDHDSLESEDRFHGRIGDTELEFCVAVMHWHTMERRKDRTVRHDYTDRMLFLAATANKPLSGETRILPDYLEAKLGDTATRPLTAHELPSGLHLIHMEDADFENHFKVYCDDDVEAHYILTPSMMTRITGYRERLQRQMYLTFTDDRLYAKITPTLTQSEAIFDVDLFDNLLDFKVMEVIYHQVEMAVGIVEELNLNARVWSVEPAQPA